MVPFCESYLFLSTTCDFYDYYFIIIVARFFHKEIDWCSRGLAILQLGKTRRQGRAGTAVAWIGHATSMVPVLAGC